MKVLNSLKHKKRNLSFSFDYNINNITTKFYSCNFSLVREKDNYLVNYRCVNYLTEPSFKFTNFNEFITINVFIKYDKEFNILDKLIIPPDFNFLNMGRGFIGVEDIRLFNYNENILFTGAVSFDKYRSIDNGVMCGNYLEYCKKKITYQTYYKNRQEIEKNWVFFDNKKQLYIIYKWFPLTICELINSDKDKQNKLVSKKEFNIDILREMRGSSNGIHYNNEIWFITHKTLGGNRTFQHYFVIFDLNLNLLKISEPFKFENYIREYCICFYIENDNIFIGYSTNDNTSILNIYNKQDLLDNIEFTSNV